LVLGCNEMRWKRTYWPYFLAVLTIGLIFQSRVWPPDLSESDFGQPWIAGKAVLNGLNPYQSHESILGQLEEVRHHDSAFFHTPNLFVFLLPLSKFSHETASQIMTVLNLAAIFLIVWIYFGLLRKNVDEVCSLAWMIVSLFSVLLLISESVTLNLTLGNRSIITGFLMASAIFLLLNPSPTRRFWAGVLIGLTALKPNLFLFCYFLFLSRALKDRDWYSLGGLFCSGLASIVVPSLFRPELLSDFFSADLGRAGVWDTPTAGVLIPLLTGKYQVMLRFVPMLLLIFAVVSISSLRQKILTWPLSVLLIYGLPVSILMAPYAWPYDFVPIYIAFGFVLVAHMQNVARYHTPILITMALAIFEIVRNTQTGSYLNAIWYPLIMAIVFYLLARPRHLFCIAQKKL